MTNLYDVIDAWAEAERAREELRRAEVRYREVVRAAIADGIRQAQIAKALDRSRELIRLDAMTEEQREKRKASRRRTG